MILKPDKKDLRLGGYMFFTYTRKLCYDDNYIKPIAMTITSNTFKIPLSIIILFYTNTVNTVLYR